MDWLTKAKKVFKTEKPKHFTNFLHCEECYEHDETLLKFDIDTIGLEELGNSGWDPICFTSNIGKKYYMPALINLSIKTIYTNDFYLDQLLFHLEYDGINNELYKSCNKLQREFICDFMEYIINNYPEQIEKEYCVDQIFEVHNIWSK